MRVMDVCVMDAVWAVSLCVMEEDGDCRGGMLECWRVKVLTPLMIRAMPGVDAV